MTKPMEPTNPEHDERTDRTAGEPPEPPRPPRGRDLVAAAEHARWEDAMIAALDGRLAGPDRKALDGHLAGCADCRAAWDEYRELFRGLRHVLPQEPSHAFWEELAADVDRRVAAEAGPRGPGGRSPAAEPGVLDVSGRIRARSGWLEVAAGLVAACLAVLVLGTLYLRLPRDLGEPQAFTTPPRPQLAEGGEDPGPGGWGEDAGAPPAGSEAELLAGLAARLGEGPAEGLPVLDEALDPLVALVDPQGALEGLSAAETEELLRLLEEEPAEART